MRGQRESFEQVKKIAGHVMWERMQVRAEVGYTIPQWGSNQTAKNHCEK